MTHQSHPAIPRLRRFRRDLNVISALFCEVLFEVEFPSPSLPSLSRDTLHADNSLVVILLGREMQGFWLLFDSNPNYNLNSRSLMKPVISYS